MKAALKRAAARAYAAAVPLTARWLRLGRRLRVPWEAFERSGVLPVPVHFYHPYPESRELARGGFWDRASGMPGVAIDEDACVRLLAGLGGEFGAECDWPPVPGPGGGYYDANDQFGFASAAVAHGMVRRLKPRRVVEIGSGYSTVVLGAALGRNASEGAPAAEFTAIEPHPGALLRRGVPGLTRLIEEKLEVVEDAVFGALGSGDVLFIDSSHVIRYGGDVLRAFLEILPSLAPGVVVHVHDIHLPEPYPRAYFENERYVWNEQYLLQAFLCHNNAYEVLLPCWLLHRRHDAAFARAFPRYDPTRHRPGSSFWLRRK